MKVHIVKLSHWRIPRQFIHQWMKNLEKELICIFQKPARKNTKPKTHIKHRPKKSSDFNIKNQEITLAFLETGTMKKLNRDFRSKNKATDILSFSGFEPKELGEIALCGQIIEKQAKIHQIRPKEELGYLLIHGVLHLLGYEHEKSDKEAKIMFELQDEIFETLRKKVL